ncbi:Mss4-like protein [Pseudocohnilembus persalinus]|uniref:Mss4-like protein n=1 Tax=Pseudocohnilembus persalinus TaxID=266149 RepID=A0A0V0QBC3_PSEPJ|nr:Mss4-like protein [Pseudocohnilembus persalinus]|eukprot:KRW99548.1 Mss4-like protein [Pseudocohnilembus persalinus]
MKIYKDIFSGEEIISDSYTNTGEKMFGDFAVKVKTKSIVKGEENFDVGCGNAFGGEQEEEQGGAAQEKVIDIVDTYQYQTTSFDKKGYLTHFKKYMKRVLEHLQENKPERVDGFKKEAAEFVKWVQANFDEFEFYIPESFDMDNHIVLSIYEGEDQMSPYFIYLLDGLKGENI